MNFLWSPDNEWDYIASLTGDDSWGHEHMRRHLQNVENCTYVPVGTPGHGFEGYVVVRDFLLISR
jgi:choline dehydrogenase